MKKWLPVICLCVVVAGVVGVKLYAENVAEKKFDKKIAEFSNHADVEYGNVSVDLLGMDVNLHDVRIAVEQNKLNIQKITIKNIDQDSDIPNFMSVVFEGVKLEKHITDSLELETLGYEEDVFVDISIDYKYNAEKEELALNNFCISADSIGGIDASFNLENIELDAGKLLFGYPKIMFVSAQIQYKDDSLFERILTRASKNKKKSVEEMRNDAISNINRDIEKEKDVSIKTAMEQVRDFIENPDEFSISAKPEKHWPLGRLMRVNNPKALIKMLSLEIKS